MQVRLAQYLHERLGTINQKLRTLQTVRRRLALLLRQLESATVATCPASKSLGHVAPFSVSPSFRLTLGLFGSKIRWILFPAIPCYTFARACCAFLGTNSQLRKCLSRASLADAEA